MTAAAEAGRQRINLRHLFRNRLDRLIDDTDPGWLYDLEIGNLPVFFDSNFDERRDLRACWNTRRRLHPFAVETVVQHVAVPTKFRCSSRSAAAAFIFPCAAFLPGMSGDRFLERIFF